MRPKIAMLVAALAALDAEPSARDLFERARLLEAKSRNLSEAVRLYGLVVSQAKAERGLAARAQY